MKITTRLNRFAIAGVASIALFAVTKTSLAATATNDTQTNTQTAATSQIPSDAKHVQDFESAGLSIQFRYQGGKLSAVRLKNVAKDPIHVKMLAKSYILGPQDSLVVDPPNVKYLHIKHGPSTALGNTTDKLLPNRFNKHDTYKLPKQ